jgi:RNA polymerase sigma-70 factor (ECF subfamily)
VGVGKLVKTIGQSFVTAENPTERDEQVARAAAGDRAALQEVFARLFPVVHKHVGFLLGFGPLVEDAVQDCMLEIHRALPGFRHQASLSTWALAITSRVAIRHARGERRRRGVEVDAVELDLALYSNQDVEVDGELALLARSLGKIGFKKRVAFVLMAILECSATEAGEILGVSANTAASRFRHARQELLSLLDPERIR